MAEIQVIFEAVIKFRPHGKRGFNGIVNLHGYHSFDPVRYLFESRTMIVQDGEDDDLMTNEEERVTQILENNFDREITTELSIVRVRRVGAVVRRRKSVQVEDSEFQKLMNSLKSMELTADQRSEMRGVVG